MDNTTEPTTDTVQHPTGSNATPHSEIDSLVRDLWDVGLSWAGYGLGAGRRALTQSARTLDLLAEHLGQLARRLSPSAEAKE